MKKILAVIAAAVVAFSLIGCVTDEEGVNWTTYTKDKQNYIGYYAQIAPNTTLNGTWYIPDTVFFAGTDSDPKNAIKGRDNDYIVDYTNPEDKLYRAFKKTAFKHAGAVIKVTFDSTNVSSSKMGVIFDLKPNAENPEANDFYIIGLNPRTDVANFYVSKFTNVTDMQAENFGTKLDTNPAKEIIVVDLATKNNIKPPKAVDGKISFYVYYKLMSDGSFDYAILDITDEQLADFKGDKNFLAAKIDDYNPIVKGNTLAKCKAEYEAAEKKQ